MKSYTIKELKELSHEHPIIAFDGVCNLCNGFIQWLIKRDHKNLFRYTTLQSDLGSIMKSNINVEGESVILIHEGELYSLSDVGLKCMSILGGIWTPLSYLRFIPKSFRDSVYNLIARNRYRWFGKSDVCMVPDSKIQSLFL